MRLLVKWVVGVAALYATVYAGHFLFATKDLRISSDILSSFLTVAALAVVNTFIRPIATFLTMPLNCLTLGLMRFVINAVLFWFVGAMVPGGLEVKGPLPALFGSIVYSAITGTLDHLVVDPLTKNNGKNKPKKASKE
jgi:putative membrane protein